MLGNFVECARARGSGHAREREAGTQVSGRIAGVNNRAADRGRRSAAEIEVFDRGGVGKGSAPGIELEIDVIGSVDVAHQRRGVDSDLVFCRRTDFL